MSWGCRLEISVMFSLFQLTRFPSWVLDTLRIWFKNREIDDFNWNSILLLLVDLVPFYSFLFSSIYCWLSGWRVSFCGLCAHQPILGVDLLILIRILPVQHGFVEIMSLYHVDVCSHVREHKFIDIRSSRSELSTVTVFREDIIFPGLIVDFSPEVLMLVSVWYPYLKDSRFKVSVLLKI